MIKLKKDVPTNHESTSQTSLSMAFWTYQRKLNRIKTYFNHIFMSINRDLPPIILLQQPMNEKFLLNGIPAWSFKSSLLFAQESSCLLQRKCLDFPGLNSWLCSRKTPDKQSFPSSNVLTFILALQLILVDGSGNKGFFLVSLVLPARAHEIV